MDLSAFRLTATPRGVLSFVPLVGHPSRQSPTSCRDCLLLEYEMEQRTCRFKSSFSVAQRITGISRQRPRHEEWDCHPRPFACHPEPFACHPERSEGSPCTPGSLTPLRGACPERSEGFRMTVQDARIRVIRWAAPAGILAGPMAMDQASWPVRRTG